MKLFILPCCRGRPGEGEGGRREGKECLGASALQYTQTLVFACTVWPPPENTVFCEEKIRARQQERPFRKGELPDTHIYIERDLQREIQRDTARDIKIQRERPGERQRETERERHRETSRDIKRNPTRQRETEGDRERHRDTERDTERPGDTETDRESATERDIAIPGMRHRDVDPAE